MKKIEYKWVVYVICFVTIFVCLGFCSSNKSIYLSAITEAFNIKRSLYSINDSCRFVASTIINLFFGTLISRFCAKKLMAAGYISLILSMLIYANAADIWGFYIGGCFLGMKEYMNPYVAGHYSAKGLEKLGAEAGKTLGTYEANLANS